MQGIQLTAVLFVDQRDGLLHGGEDWHAWGTKVILPHQEKAGSWSESPHGPLADTCFALLFLVRANLFQDLTDKLQALAMAEGIRMDVAAVPPAPGGRGGS